MLDSWPDVIQYTMKLFKQVTGLHVELEMYEIVKYLIFKFRSQKK